MLQVDLYLALDSTRWSERYHFDQPDAKALPVLARIVGDRSDLMAVPTVLEYGSVQVVGQKGSRVRQRFMRTNNFNGAEKVGLFGIFPRWPAGVASSAIGVGFRTDANARRILWLAGFPDLGRLAGVQKRRVLLPYDMTKKLRQFITLLTGEQLKLCIELLDRTLLTAAHKVTSVGVDASGLYLITTADAHGFTEDDQVRVLGSRGNNLTRARGLRRVIGVPAPTQLVIDRGPLPEKGPVVYTGGARLAGVRYTFDRAIWEPLHAPGVEEFPVPPYYIGTGTPEFLIASKLRGGGTPPRRGRDRNRER